MLPFSIPCVSVDLGGGDDDESDGAESGIWNASSGKTGETLRQVRRLAVQVRRLAVLVLLVAAGLKKQKKGRPAPP